MAFILLALIIKWNEPPNCNHDIKSLNVNSGLKTNDREQKFLFVFQNIFSSHSILMAHFTTAMLRLNGLWEVIQISPFNTMWKNPCIWSSKSCQLHVVFKFQMWCWPCIFRYKHLKSNFSWRVAVPN